MSSGVLQTKPGDISSLPRGVFVGRPSAVTWRSENTGGPRSAPSPARRAALSARHAGQPGGRAPGLVVSLGIPARVGCVVFSSCLVPANQEPGREFMAVIDVFLWHRCPRTDFLTHTHNV